MHNVYTDITVGSISSVAAARYILAPQLSLTHKGSLGLDPLMLII